jgi:hypothetical protein
MCLVVLQIRFVVSYRSRCFFSTEFRPDTGLIFMLKAEAPPQFGTCFAFTAYPSEAEEWMMLVERGVRVMNMGVVGDAYAIASNYLRRTGAIADNFATDERLLEIIVQMFQRGEVNKIRLANKAIAKFEAQENV